MSKKCIKVVITILKSIKRCTIMHVFFFLFYVLIVSPTRSLARRVINFERINLIAIRDNISRFLCGLQISFLAKFAYSTTVSSIIINKS